MKLSISNIAWPAEWDQVVFDFMKKYGYSGLEIAPTRIFPEAPYDRLADAVAWSKELKKHYHFSIPSMQSIWFGRQEKIFGSDEERKLLLDYTKKAIDFASSIECKNLVFGCPRNRDLPEGLSDDIAIDFFREIGSYAAENGTVIGMEANPPIYNTNYVNDTASALKLIKQVGANGFLLNLDVGTMIHNREHVSNLEGNVHLIHHVHISEPGLKMIEKRELHQELKQVLTMGGYSGFVSIEMGKQQDLSVIEKVIQYVGGVFGDI